MYHKERRTGARMFILSGTVGDDPLVFIERHVGNIAFKLTQWSGYRTCCVTISKGSWAAHIYDDGFAAVKGGLCIFHVDTRHTRF